MVDGRTNDPESLISMNFWCYPVSFYGDYGTIKSMSILDSDYGYVKLSKKTPDEQWKVNTFGAVEIL